MTEDGGTHRSRGLSSCSTRRHDEYVAAIIENRALEVGIAICNLQTLHIQLTQFSDTIAYGKAAAFLQSRNPTTLIFAHNAPSESTLYRVLSHILEGGTNLACVHRKFFNESKGARRLLELASCTAALSHVTDTANYLSLAAAGALVEYVEEMLMSALVPNTVKISAVELSNCLVMDRLTLKALRVVDAVPGPAGASRQPPLVDLVDHTITPGGRRLLRMTVLQPLRDVGALRQRQQAVVALRESPTLHARLIGALKHMAGVDVDRIIAVFSLQPQHDTLASIQGIIDATIAVRGILNVAASLPDVLATMQTSSTTENTTAEGVSAAAAAAGAGVQRLPADHAAASAAASDEAVAGLSLLSRVCEAIHACEIQNLLHFISQVVDEDVVNATGSDDGRRAAGAVLQVQHCFSLKAPPDSLIHNARSRFSAAVEGVYRLLEATRTEAKSNTLKVTYNAKRGYFFTCHSREQALFSSHQFHSKTSQGAHLSFSSSALGALNATLGRCVEDILGCCEDVARGVRAFFHSCMGVLQALSEALSLVDLVCSLAAFANTLPSVCLPMFTDGETTIVDGYTPLSATVPNSFSFGARGVDAGGNEGCSLMLVTGPNGSGKSTFSQMAAHVAILAQCGSLVPARSARVHLYDRLMALVPAADTVDICSSSFTREMAQLASVLQHATRHSLVIVDELGRGTSNTEGSCLAWAAAEYLLDVRCHTVFTTHALSLARFAEESPGARCFHFEVLYDDTCVAAEEGPLAAAPPRPHHVHSHHHSVLPSVRHAPMTFTFKLADGCTDISSYGIPLLETIVGRNHSLVLRSKKFLSHTSSH